MRRDVAEHEGRHVAAAVLKGIPVTKATARPDGEMAGSVRLGFEELDRDIARRMADVLLAGSVDDTNWPPAWPPSANASAKDERDLALIVDYLGLDKQDWDRLVTESLEFAATREFTRLETGYACFLEQRDLDEQSTKYIKAIVEGNMEHKTMQATAVVADQGSFEALAATWALDRSGEQIRRGAFSETIKQWRLSGRRLPVHWDHRGGDPAFIIGSVDPTSMRETSEGLRVAGQLDLEESEIAREAWRAMKHDSIGLSFGYLVTKSHRQGDVCVLDELDLFEVTLTSSPVNAATRVLNMKALLDKEPLTSEGLRVRCEEAGVLPRRKAVAAPVQVTTFSC